MTARRDALLVLEDGTAFAGEAFTAPPATVAGEVVFNTAMGGYQEVLTDLSYAGSWSDGRARGRQLRNRRRRRVRPGPGGRVPGPPGGPAAVQLAAQRSLAEELEAAGVPGAEGLDTRRLVRHLRQRGAMRGALSTEVTDPSALRELALAAPDPNGLAMVDRVTRAEPVELPADGEERHRVVLYDFGAKANIARRLRRLGARVRVVPAATPAAEALAWRLDGVMLSNGPGDPATVGHGVQATRELLGQVPAFGICLGHQLLGQAAGGRTVRLKFGHRGVNQPVVELATGRVAVTSHNHGFAVDGDSLPATAGSPTPTPTTAPPRAWSVGRARLSVQYHPEAAPGPHDAHPLFERFADLMRGARHG